MALRIGGVGGGVVVLIGGVGLRGASGLVSSVLRLTKLILLVLRLSGNLVRADVLGRTGILGTVVGRLLLVTLAALLSVVLLRDKLLREKILRSNLLAGTLGLVSWLVGDIVDRLLLGIKLNKLSFGALRLGTATALVLVKLVGNLGSEGNLELKRLILVLKLVAGGVILGSRL